MPRATFSQAHPKIKPPAYCITKKFPLIPWVPGSIPTQLQGYCRWTDLDPMIPLDIAAYMPMPQVRSAHHWAGQMTKYGITVKLSLQRVSAPNNYKVEIAIEDYYASTETYTFTDVHLDGQGNWATGTLTYVHNPGYDYRIASIAI